MAAAGQQSTDEGLTSRSPYLQQQVEGNEMRLGAHHGSTGKDGVYGGYTPGVGIRYDIMALS